MGIISLIPLLDEFVCTGNLSRLFPLFFAQVIVSEPDVLFDSAREEKSFLGDKTNQRVKGLLFPVFDIDAIDKDFSSLALSKRTSGSETIT